jgi:hypothetical protein
MKADVYKILEMTIPYRVHDSVIIETKECARIGYNGFLFPHEYSGEGLGSAVT